MMKTLLLGALAASLLTISARDAGAAVDVLTFQESGSITLNGLGLAVLGQRQSDPGPGGLTSALTFTLNFPLGPAISQPLVGDVLVEEPGAPGVVSDVVRFNAGKSMVFYSIVDAGGPTLAADTGLPAAYYANLVHTIEGQLYAPGPNDPGYAINQASGLPLSYSIISSAVPEAGTLSLMLCGVALLGLRRRRSSPQRRFSAAAASRTSSGPL